MNAVDLSIIIVNWNTKQLLLNCIASIYDTVRQVTFEIILVDNGSTDGSLEALKQTYPAVTMIANGRNLGFAAANNKGIRVMRGRYAVLLNSDTVLKEGALDKMLDFMETHPDAGMCGPQLLNEDGSKQNSVGNFPTLLSEFMSKKLICLLFPGNYKQTFKPTSGFKGIQKVDYIVGACMVVRKTAMESVGLLDEDYFFLLEEVDWCCRMQRTGWKVYHLPGIEIYHLGGQSMKDINLRVRVEYCRSRFIFFRKKLNLSAFSFGLFLLAGAFQAVVHFLEYSVLNLLTLFMLFRLRSRWHMFTYLVVWHLRGRPESMGLPR